MIAFIIGWFKSLNPLSKFLVIVFILLLSALAVQSGRLARSEYKRLKSIEKKYEEAEKRVEESEKKETEIVKKNFKKTTESKEKNESINEKLKEDEKVIDNSNVSDGDILDFITKHQKG